ncbi:Arabinose operon regulatory protein [compost metagenome]
MERFDDPSHYDKITSGILISGHFQVNDTYSTNRPDGMNDWLIAYTLSGKGYFNTPEGNRECSSGDIVLLRPGTPHSYGTVKGEVWNFIWAHFTSHPVSANLLPAEPLLIYTFRPDAVRNRVYQAFRRLLSDSRERNDYWQELCLHSLHEILILLSQGQRQKLDPRIIEAMHYLSIHMRSPVQVEELSRSIGISPSRLSHLFKEQTGLSIIDTLNQLRIRQAALLLKHTNRSASETAYDVGFHNYNHFIKQFHKWIGTNPSSYRKSISSNHEKL